MLSCVGQSQEGTIAHGSRPSGFRGVDPSLQPIGITLVDHGMKLIDMIADGQKIRHCLFDRRDQARPNVCHGAMNR